MLLISSFLTTNLKPNVKVANYLGKLAVTIVEQGKLSQTGVDQDWSLHARAVRCIPTSTRVCKKVCETYSGWVRTSINCTAIPKSAQIIC